MIANTHKSLSWSRPASSMVGFWQLLLLLIINSSSLSSRKRIRCDSFVQSSRLTFVNQVPEVLVLSAVQLGGQITQDQCEGDIKLLGSRFVTWCFFNVSFRCFNLITLLANVPMIP